jgi:hypothetical protein
MTNSKSKSERVAHCPPPSALEKHNPQLKHLGGSKYHDWNTLVANQAMQSGWFPNKTNAEQHDKICFGP